ncbi:hypothetical protein [Saliphagus sp. LR7]|uniref:hypothetical protein n=1 Tax=Saliphagus sp. LR7 TaxID=2282654 RepID=UPI000DF81429|nr:hypothetical protein [Saliphagus sp. LR7]
MSPMIPTMARTADGETAEGAVGAIPEPVRKLIGEYGRDGSISMAAGAISVVRGLQLMRSNRSRGFAKLLFGAGWIMIGLVQRQHATDGGRGDRSEELDETLGDEIEADDVTPGETDDDMAAANTIPPSGVGEPEGHDVGETGEVETAAEPAEMTGPSGEDAVPEEDKTTVPDEPPTSGVSMVGEDDEKTDEDEADGSGEDGEADEADQADEAEEDEE